MKTKAELQRATLQSDLHKALESHRRGCSHERDIASEVTEAVEKVLERYGLLSMVDPETTVELVPKCGFCSSTETELKHAKWCVEAR